MWGGVFINLLNLQGFTHSFGGPYIAGISNTWFVTAIALCYLLTPLLQKLRKHSSTMVVALTLAVILGYLFVESDTWMFVASWLYLYSLSYFYANLSDKSKRTTRLVLIVLTMIAVVLIVSQRSLAHPYGRIVKDLAGLVSVTVVLHQLAAMKRLQVYPAVNLLSKYSYEIYLVNYLFTVGPVSPAHLTPWNILNVCVCLLAIIISTYILAKLTQFMIKAVNRN